MGLIINNVMKGFVLLVFFVLLISGVYASSFSEVDIKSVDAEKFNFGFVLDSSSKVSNNVVKELHFYFILPVREKYFLFPRVSKLSYPQKQYDECLLKMKKSSCEFLANKFIEIYKSNVEQRERNYLRDLLKRVKREV